MTRQSVIWSISAVLGIICAASIAWAASQLAGQHIGLASEPLSVARGLAPADREPPARPSTDGRATIGHPAQARRRTAHSVPPTTTTPVLPQTTPPVLTPTTTVPSNPVPPAATSSSSSSGAGGGQTEDGGGGSGGSGQSGGGNHPDD